MFTEQTLTGNKLQGRKVSEQEEVQSIRKKAIRLKLFIYNQKIHSSIVQMIKAGAKTPVRTLAKIAPELLSKFEKDGGAVINDAELLEALSKMVIKELISIAASMDVITEEQFTSDLLFRIVGLAQQHWDKQNPNRVDKGRAKRLMENGRKDPAMAEALARQAREQGLEQAGKPLAEPGGELPQEEMPAQAPSPAQQPQQMVQPSRNQEQIEAPPQVPREAMQQ